MGFAMPPDRMSFAVLGPGGVGGLLAALLSRGGDRVVVLHDSGPREIHVESKRFGDFTASVDAAPRLAEPVDAVLAPMALLTTHERANIGEVRARRREDLEALVREFASVAAAEGVAIDPIANLAFIERAPETMETSMQRDQAAGRQIEIDALGGALLRRAAKAGIEVPVTERIVEDLKKRTSRPA